MGEKSTLLWRTQDLRRDCRLILSEPLKDNTCSVVQTETRRLAAIMFTDIVGFNQ